MPNNNWLIDDDGYDMTGTAVYIYNMYPNPKPNMFYIWWRMMMIASIVASGLRGHINKGGLCLLIGV